MSTGSTVKIKEGTQEVWTDPCEFLQGKEFFQGLLDSFLGSWLRMSNPLQLCIRDSPKPEATEPRSPDHKTDETPALCTLVADKRSYLPGGGETPAAHSRGEVTTRAA